MKRLLYYLPALACMTLIFIMSHRPSPDSLSHWPTFFGVSLLHVVGYGGLCGCLLFGMIAGSEQDGISVHIWALILTIIYGLSDEFHQSFIPGRTPDVLDVIADAIGGTFAVFGYSVLRGVPGFRWIDFRRFRFRQKRAGMFEN